MEKRDRKVAGRNSPAVHDGDFVSKWPELWEHLTATQYSDGTKRETSTLMMFFQDGVFKAMLRDKDQGLCAWVSAVTYFGALDAIELALIDTEFEWRQDRQQDGQPARRTKRK